MGEIKLHERLHTEEVCQWFKESSREEVGNTKTRCVSGTGSRVEALIRLERRIKACRQTPVSGELHRSERV